MNGRSLHPPYADVHYPPNFRPDRASRSQTSTLIAGSGCYIEHQGVMPVPFTAWYGRGEHHRFYPVVLSCDFDFERMLSGRALLADAFRTKGVAREIRGPARALIVTPITRSSQVDIGAVSIDGPRLAQRLTRPERCGRPGASVAERGSPACRSQVAVRIDTLIMRGIRYKR